MWCSSGQGDRSENCGDSKECYNYDSAAAACVLRRISARSARRVSGDAREAPAYRFPPSRWFGGNGLRLTSARSSMWNKGRGPSAVATSPRLSYSRVLGPMPFATANAASHLVRHSLPRAPVVDILPHECSPGQVRDFRPAQETVALTVGRSPLRNDSRPSQDSGVGTNSRRRRAVLPSTSSFASSASAYKPAG